ncbi:MAG: hypothetical protein WDA15_09350, partial [Trueperaceae bacterium]
MAGTLSDLAVTLDAALEQLAALLPADYQPRGRLTALATVNLLAGPSYDGQLTLSASGDTVILGGSLPDAATEELTASFSGVGGAFALNVDGAGLQVDHVPGTGSADGRLTLMADAVDLTRFLPAGVTGVVDGQLSYGAAGWRGELEAQLASVTEEQDPGANVDQSAAAVVPNLEVTARLVGAFSTLNLELTGSALAGSSSAASRLTASGPLLPSPDVSGSLAVGDDLVTGQFHWNDGVRATLTSAAQTFGGFATLPALTAELTVDPNSGAVRLIGAPAAAIDSATVLDLDPAPGTTTTAATAAAEAETETDHGIDVSLEGGALTGTVALPLAFNGEQVLLDATVNGTLSDPSVHAEVTGPLRAGTEPGTTPAVAEITGSLSTGATVVVTAPRTALAALLPANAAAPLGVLGEEVLARAEVAPDGTWTAELNTQVAADLTAPTEALNLAVTATGEISPVLAYEGELRVLGTPAPLSTDAAGASEPDDNRTPNLGLIIASAPFSGSGAAVDARLDLAEVDWARLGTTFGVDLDIQGGGELAVSTAPFNAALSVDLTGHFADNAVSLRGTAPDDLSLTLNGPAGHLEGSLAWSDSITGGGTALLSGELADRPVELRLSVSDGLTSGDLELQAVGARVTAQLVTLEPDPAADSGAVRHVSVSADVPVGSWASFGGSAEAEVTIEANRANLDSLAASIDGLLGEPNEPLNRLTLVAAGPLTSDLRVRGVVTSPRLQESLVLEVSGASADEPSVTARLNWRELIATASLKDGGTVSLSGRAAGTDLVSLMRGAGGVLPAALASEVAHLSPSITDVDLTWAAQTGWRGHLVGGAELPWLPAIDGVTLRAEGDRGALRIAANAAVPDGSARLEVLAPGRVWTTAPLAGELQVDLPSSVLLPGVNVPLRLQSTASIGGTAASPNVTGTLQVGGVVTAEGDYTFADGVGHLNATGPELTITGRVGAGGASAEAQVDSLAVGPWLTQLPDGLLSVEARFSGSQVSVDSIRLSTPTSSLTGRATVGLGGNGAQEARFSAALDANVDLADLNLGDVNLTGTVRGPLVVSASSLRNLPSSSVVANLAALHVGTVGLDWSVSGNLTIGGTLADPMIATQLTGDGELRGLLSATARPSKGEYAVTSTLSIGQVATDLRVDLGSGTTQAAGTVRVGDGLLIVTQSERAGAETGEDAAPPPDLVVTGAGRFAGVGAQVRGDLSAVTVAGDLGRLSEALEGQLALSADSQADDWLSGEITGLTVSGYALAPLTINAVTMGAPVLIESSDLRATFDPATFDWSVGVTDYRLNGGEDPPYLTLWGRGRGAVGTLDASLNTSDFELALEVRHDETTTLLVEGDVYGGQVFVTAERSQTSGEWSGGGRLTGSSLAGFAVNAQATVLGVGLVPTLVLSTRAENGLLLTGNASVGTDGITLDQFMSGAPLEQMLRVQGRVLPRTDLTLSTLDLQPGTAVTVAEATRATTS